MKISIVQSEIEEGIRNYIRDQISIREGMEITIDLRSTRGDSGFTADIDISPIKAEKATSQVGSQVKQTSAPKAPEPKAEPKQEPVNQGKEQEPPLEGTTETSEGTNTQEAGEQAEGTNQQAATSEGETGAQQAEGTKPRSLFGNMKRVSNS